MEIEINREKIFRGEKYQILINGQQSHFVKEELVSHFLVISLFESNYGALRITINKILDFVLRKYEIKRLDNSILEFRSKSMWRLHYQCQCGNDVYDICAKKGDIYLIYKNNSQVAWWDIKHWWNKEVLLWFSGKSYKIIAEDDCDIDLIISFCLIVDNFSSNNQQS
jgi:hypothetical protein